MFNINLQVKKFFILTLGFFTFNAHGAADPSSPGLAIGADVRASRVTNVNVGIIKAGNGNIYFSDSSLVDGGIFGYYDKNYSDKSWMVVSLPVTALQYWNSNISTGIYYKNLTTVTSLTKLKMVVSPQYPFNWNIDPNAVKYGAGTFYNQVYFVPAATPNYFSNGVDDRNPRGLQVQQAELQGLSDALNSLPLITLSSVDVYYREYSQSADVLDGIQRGMSIPSANTGIPVPAIPVAGVNLASVNLTPYDAGSLSFNTTGEVVISPSGKILSVPAACTVTTVPVGMLCPLDLRGIKSFVKYKSNNVGVLFKSGPSAAGTTTLSTNTMTNVFYSAQWILDKVSTQDTNVLENYQSLSLGSIVVSAINVPFDQFSKLTIKKLSYAVAIQELTPGAVYSGVVGQSGIRIPYLVTQSGDSKATSVTVKVFNNDRPGALEADSCAFHTDLNNPSKNQVIAVPLSLDFYNPTALSFKQTRRPGCNGTPMEIGGLDMPWFDTYDSTNMYQNGQLGLDMVFDLTDSAVQTDMNGGYWQGTATGTGQISVEATWN